MGGVERGRRNTGYWAPFNVWWRAHLEKHGERPKADDLKKWFLEESKEAFPHEPPTYTMIRNHAKGLRDIASVKNYFRDYRARKRRAVADLVGGPSPRSEASEDDGGHSGGGSGASGTDLATSEDDYQAAAAAKRKKPDHHHHRRTRTRAGSRSAAPSAAGGSGQNTPPTGSQVGSLLRQQTPAGGLDASGDLNLAAVNREKIKAEASGCGPAQESLWRSGMDSQRSGTWQPQQQQLMQPRSQPQQPVRSGQDLAGAATGLRLCNSVLGGGGNNPQSSGRSPYRSALPGWTSDWRSLLPHEDSATTAAITSTAAAAAAAAATAVTGSCGSAGGDGETLAQGLRSTMQPSPALAGTPPLGQYPATSTPSRRRSSTSAAVVAPPPLPQLPQATATGSFTTNELAAYAAGRTSPSVKAVHSGGRGGVMLDASGLGWGHHLGQTQPLAQTGGGVTQLSPSQHPVSPLSDTAPSPSSAAVRHSDRYGLVWGSDGLCSNLMPGMAVAGGGAVGGGMTEHVVGDATEGEKLGPGLQSRPRRVVESAPLRDLPMRMHSSPLLAEGGPEALQSQVWTPFALALTGASELADSERQTTSVVAKEPAAGYSMDETRSSVHYLGRMQSLKAEATVSTAMAGPAATPSTVPTASLQHSPMKPALLGEWTAASTASGWAQSLPPLPPLPQLPDCARYSSTPARTPFELDAFQGPMSAAHTAASAASPPAAFPTETLPNLPTSFGDAMPQCTTGGARYTIDVSGGPTARESSSPLTPTACRTAGPPPVTTGFMPSKGGARSGSGSGGPPVSGGGLPLNGLPGAGGSPGHGGLGPVPGYPVLTGACGPQLSGSMPPQSCAVSMSADTQGAAAAATAAAAAMAVAAAELGANSSNDTPRSRPPASNSPPFGSGSTMAGHNGACGTWGADAPSAACTQVWSYPAATAPAMGQQPPPPSQLFEPAGQHLQSGFPGAFSSAPSGPSASSLSPPRSAGCSNVSSGGGGMPACPPPAQMRYVPYHHPHPRMPPPQGYYPRPYPYPPGARYPVGRYPPYPAPTVPFVVRRRHVSPPPLPQPPSYLMQEGQDSRFASAGGLGQARDTWDSGQQQQAWHGGNNRGVPQSFAGIDPWGGAAGYNEAVPQEMMVCVVGSAGTGGMSAAFEDSGLGGGQRFPCIHAGVAGTDSSYMYGSCTTMASFDGVGQLAGPSAHGLVGSQPAPVAGFERDGGDGGSMGSLWAACADADGAMGTYVSAASGAAGTMGGGGGGSMYGQFTGIAPSFDANTMRHGAGVQDAHYWGSGSQGGA